MSHATKHDDLEEGMSTPPRSATPPPSDLTWGGRGATPPRAGGTWGGRGASATFVAPGRAGPRQNVDRDALPFVRPPGQSSPRRPRGDSMASTDSMDSSRHLPPHWSRRSTPPQVRPPLKALRKGVKSRTMRLIDMFGQDSSSQDKDISRVASCKDKKMMRGKDKQNRLVDRLDAFSQSRGKLRIVRQHVSNRLAYRDILHTIVEAPLRKIIPGLTFLYLVNVIFFAFLWWAASPYCNVGIKTFNNAFIFSTFTIMTIGYGTRDVFFDDCWEASVLIFLESIVSILLDCVSLGVVYSLISSGRRRATSILFSDRAVIHKNHGELFFQFQVVEQRRHPLTEASVRCYAVRDETDAWGRRVEFQPCAMRLEKPDDELGSMLFLSLPSLVVHRLDAWSPLVPPDWWVDAYYRWKRGDAPRKTSVVDDARSFAEFSEYAYRHPAPLRRASDAEAGYRTSHRCKICGQGFETTRDLRLHHADDHPDAPLELQKKPTHDPDVIRAYMSKARLEVICVVEGQDPIMSTCVRGLHSYRAPPTCRWDDYARSDIAWDAAFAPCVTQLPCGSCQVDFDALHDIVDVRDAVHPPPPVSHS